MRPSAREKKGSPFLPLSMSVETAMRAGWPTLAILVTVGPTVTCRFATRHFRRGHVTNHVDSLVCGAKARGGRNESLLESADSRGIPHVYQMSDASGF